MKKIVMPDDILIFEGKEITYNELKQLVITDYKYSQLSAFLQSKFQECGVSNE